MIIANLITFNQDKPTRWGESKLGSPFVGESPRTCSLSRSRDESLLRPPVIPGELSECLRKQAKVVLLWCARRSFGKAQKYPW